MEQILADKLKACQSLTNSLNEEQGTPSKDSICKLCNDTGFVPVEIDGVIYYKSCKCRNEKLRQQNKEFAEMPPQLREYKLQDFDLNKYTKEQSKAVVVCKVVKSYLVNYLDMKKNGIGLYLCSSTKGSGKTRMAASIGNQLLDKGIRVKFATSPRILTEIKSTWSRQAEITESKLLNDLIQAPVLIIDDFGTEEHKEWVDGKFYEIINERYTQKKITIFTSNYTIDELQYSDRIKSRIREMAIELAFPEESVREEQAKLRDKKIIGGAL